MPGSRPARVAPPPPGSARLQPLCPPLPRACLMLALGALLLLQPPPLELLPLAGGGRAVAARPTHVRVRNGVAGGGGGMAVSSGGVGLALHAEGHSDDDGDADVNDAEGGGGEGGRKAAAAADTPRDCRETCFSGLVEGSSATCKAQEYNPGLVYMMTDARTRARAQSHQGDRTRLRTALRRFADGGNLTVVTIGGSISAGQGAVDAPPYPKWLQQVLEANLPHRERVWVRNGAVPGTSSQYMSSCHNVHVPQDADIIFVEYAVNDDEMPMPHMNNQVRRPYERLLRKLLSYPQQPAVVLLHAFRWFQIPVKHTGQFWNSGERQQSEFGLYYGLPQLSIKACCYHYMLEGKKGFQVKRPRADPNGRIQHENFMDAQLKDAAFYYDIVHPDGHTGHRVMGEIAGQLILDVWAEVAADWKPSPADTQVFSKPLPPPMLPDNLESASDKCFIGPAFQKTMLSTDGFEWVNEGKSPQLPKWGFVSDVPDKYIKFKINTKSSRAQDNATVTVELGYLRSYENMGRAGVQCDGGCTCTTWFLDGHHEPRHSQTFLHAFKVTQAEECVIVVRVLHETSSSKHKVKITGIMVSEEPDSQAFANWAAFDWVSIASSKDPNGVFEISNAARRSLIDMTSASSAEIQRQYYETLAAAGVAGGGADAGADGSGQL